jgi:hypothetical protein
MAVVNIVSFGNPTGHSLGSLEALQSERRFAMTQDTDRALARMHLDLAHALYRPRVESDPSETHCRASLPAATCLLPTPGRSSSV